MFKTLKQAHLDGDINLGIPKPKNPVLDPSLAWELKHGVKLYDGEEPPWEEDDGNFPSADV